MPIQLSNELGKLIHIKTENGSVYNIFQKADGYLYWDTFYCESLSLNQDRYGRILKAHKPEVGKPLSLIYIGQNSKTPRLMVTSKIVHIH